MWRQIAQTSSSLGESPHLWYNFPMALQNCFILPHPVDAIPSIGKGREQECPASVKAFQLVAKKIAELAPETIVFITPHAETYADYFQIADGEVGIGSFAEFGDPNITFRLFYDKALVKAIAAEAAKRGIAAGTLGEKERYLDHGTMVPLYFLNQYYRDFKAVRISCSGESLLAHYEYGAAIRAAIESLDRKTVVIASGNLSHVQKMGASYGFSPEGAKYDEAMMRIFEEASFGELLSFDRRLLHEAKECGHRSFAIFAGLFDRQKVVGKRLCHESPFGTGYGFVEFIPGEEDQTRAFGEFYKRRQATRVSQQVESADAYAKLARDAIMAYLKHEKEPEISGNMPADLLTRKAGVFVTLRKDEKIRGCMGSVLSRKKTLGAEIINNAIAAATADPRFEALTLEQMPYVEVSVDICSKPTPILSVSDLDPALYGVMVECENRRGALLPNLPGVNTPEEQIRIAKVKAGIAPEDDVQLFRFTVSHHE